MQKYEIFPFYRCKAAVNPTFLALLQSFSVFLFDISNINVIFVGLCMTKKYLFVYHILT